jgi:hypothetical protein
VPKRYVLAFAVVCLLALFSVAAASADFTVYLPFVARMPTATPTATPTSTPTPTRVPGHYDLSGCVFFDYNGSGLQEAGEPGIQGAPVYVDSLGSALHATTGADGSYLIPNVSPGTHQVYVQSPTQDPATAFRYTNKFLGWVDIPAYEMNGVQVPAQHLADTEIQPIDWPLNTTVTGMTRVDVALMQGFVTLPFVQEQLVEPPFMYNYFDIIGRRLFPHDGSFDYQDSQDGIRLNYNGQYSSDYDPFRGIAGLSDSHTGPDYQLPLGKFIVSALPTSIALYVGGPPTRLDNPIVLWFENPEASGEHFANGCAHLHTQVVQQNQKIYRGQIIGLSGYEGQGEGPAVPIAPGTLHFDFESVTQVGWWYHDLYRYTVQLNPLPQNFWGSEASYWTKDNDPQFPLSGVALPAPTPTHTPIPATRIVIDGLASDWAGVPPVLEDPAGDALGGGDMDLVAAYVAQDDHDVCLMIRTAQNLNPQWSMLELMLDLRANEVCGHRWELRTEVRADNTFSASMEDPCGTWNPVTVSGYTVFWRDVLEIRIPRSALGADEFVRPTHTLLHVPGYQFWVDNMP